VPSESAQTLIIFDHCCGGFGWIGWGTACQQSGRRESIPWKLCAVNEVSTYGDPQTGTRLDRSSITRV
jgi:hypothetical protein